MTASRNDIQRFYSQIVIEFIRVQNRHYHFLYSDIEAFQLTFLNVIKTRDGEKKTTAV